MFVLDENFEKEYYKIIAEKADTAFEEAYTELESANNEYLSSLDLIQEYFRCYPTVDGEVIKEDFSAADILKLGELFGKTSSDVVTTYNPETGLQITKSVAEMKFPENIIYFVQQLISWIKNIVLAFIDRFVKVIKMMFGVPDDFAPTKEDLKLTLKKTKPLTFSAPVDLFKSKDVKPVTVNYISDKGTIADLAELIKGTSAGTLNNTNESFINENTLKEDEKPKIVAIQIDISQDMEKLNILLNQFLMFFDNSFGSNGEDLFKTEDLSLILKVFKEALKNISLGYSTTMDSNGLSAIDSSRIKNNLLVTNNNTEKLKKLYVDISKAINSALVVITNKQLAAAGGLGPQFKYYSAATYQELIRLLDTIDPRIKMAKKMEADLEKMKNQYDDVVLKLGKIRQSLLGIGSVAYTTILQHQISELFDSARFMSQTVTLRLTALGVYIKCLKDIREMINNANAINSSSKNAFKDLLR